MATATVIPDRVMDGMSVGRWLSFGVCACVFWAESSFVINFSGRLAPSIERALAQHLLH